MTKKQKSILYFIGSMFAGNWNSLLTKKLRSEHPYTYWTYVSVLTTYKEKSFHIYFDIARKDYEKVQDIVKNVCDNALEGIRDAKVFDTYKRICITNTYRESEDIKNMLLILALRFVWEKTPFCHTRWCGIFLAYNPTKLFSIGNQ